MELIDQPAWPTMREKLCLKNKTENNRERYPLAAMCTHVDENTHTHRAISTLTKATKKATLWQQLLPMVLVSSQSSLLPSGINYQNPKRSLLLHLLLRFFT